MAPLHLVDSSGWIEYFTDGPNAVHFAAPLSDPEVRYFRKTPI